MKTENFEIEKLKEELKEIPEILRGVKSSKYFLDIKIMDASFVKRIEKIKRVRDNI